MSSHCLVLTMAAVSLLAVSAHGQWVEFIEDPTRLDAPSSTVIDDPDEKDYAWGDVDRDGDDDLVVVRKEPFTTTGRRTNVLLINEDGVLTDRTAEFATDSDVEGDLGFLTPTNDRDVALADVNGDDWLDVITAVALTDNQPKHLSHPRVYINKGEIDGVWQGFRYEDARIPQMHATAGPRFAAVSAADLTGDDRPDLFFSDYDDGGGQIFDYNDRLLINDGNGFFTDETTLRLTPEMYTSAFGVNNNIADMNGDGFNDIVRLSANATPYHVGVAYNDPDNVGFFDRYDMIYLFSGYEFATGHLNDDGRLDLVVVDDVTDQYMVNQGNDADDQAIFAHEFLPPQTNVINAGNVVIADLELDGHNDVLIADVDVTLVGCDHRTFIFRNTGVGAGVSFAEEDEVIPNDDLTGVYDIAAMDIDGDGRLDLVLGRCDGTRVWMNVAPASLQFSYPQPLPQFIAPDDVTQFDVQVSGVGNGEPAPGSGRQYVSVDGGAFVESSMQDLGSGLYRATLSATSCPSTVRFYFSAEMVAGGTLFDPPSGAAAAYVTLVAAGSEIALRDEIEGDVSSWTVENQNPVNGAWEQADPNGTLVGGNFAAPDDDATPDPGVLAFVTENGAPGAGPGVNDLDDGPTRLISPQIDLTDTDAVISYARWFFCDDEGTASGDFLTVDISNDGGRMWTPVPEHMTGGTGSSWEVVSLIVSDYVEPTDDVRLRFTASDQPNDSITEAGIDDFQVDALVCVACEADFDGTGSVGVGDLLQMLNAWGVCAECDEDLNDSGAVDVGDLLILLAAWGPCG